MAGVAAVAGCLSGADDGEPGDGDGEGDGNDDSGADGPRDGPERSPDDSTTSESGIVLEVNRTRVVNELVVVYGAEEETYKPPGDDAYLLVEVTAQNDSDEVVSLPRPRDFVVVLDSEQVEPEFERGPSGRYPERITEPVEGEVYEPISEAQEGVMSSGWVAFPVPRDATHGRFSWAEQDIDRTSNHQFELEFDPASLPHLSVVEIDAPATTELPEIPVDVVVENTGGETGQWTDDVVISSGTGWSDQVAIEETVSAQSTATITKPIEVREIGVHDIYVGSDGVTTNVEPQQLGIGEAFHVEGVAEMAVIEREVAKAYQPREDDTDAYSAADGRSFVFYKFMFENTTDDEQLRPGQDHLDLVVDDRRIEPSTPQSGVDGFAAPVEAAVLKATLDDGFMDPGQRREEAIFFEVEDSLLEGADPRLEMRLSFDAEHGETGAVWS